MESPCSAADAASAHGQELAALRGLLALAGRRFVDTYVQEYGEAPTGSLLSSGVRRDLVRLLGERPLTSTTGVEVEVHGEDCIRLWLPAVEWAVPVRSRPRLTPRPAVEEEPWKQGDLFEGVGLEEEPADDFTPGDPVIFWRWEDGRVARFSIARVKDINNLGAFCEILEEVQIGEGVLPLRPPAPGSGNADDDLEGLVSRRSDEEPMTEDEVEDREGEGSADERGDATGEESS